VTRNLAGILCWGLVWVNFLPAGDKRNVTATPVARIESCTVLVEYRVRYDPYLYMNQPESATRHLVLAQCDSVYRILNRSGLSAAELVPEVRLLTRRIREVYETDYRREIVRPEPSRVQYYYFPVRE
jgi:hypothetical protein